MSDIDYNLLVIIYDGMGLIFIDFRISHLQVISHHMNRIILFIFCLILASSIHMPMKPNRPRCISEFLLGGGVSSVKITINFPKLQNLQPGEHFTVSIRNTETQKVDTDIVQPGDRFAKEVDLQKNVIYEVCILLKSERDVQVLIEYEAQTKFLHDHTEIQVPKSLLTKSDMKGAFLSAAYLADTLKEYSDEHKYRYKEETNVYLQTEKLNHKLTILSGIQITVIICAGLYQFLTLKNYLSSKQYI